MKRFTLGNVYIFEAKLNGRVLDLLNSRVDFENHAYLSCMGWRLVYISRREVERLPSLNAGF